MKSPAALLAISLSLAIVVGCGSSKTSPDGDAPASGSSSGGGGQPAAPAAQNAFDRLDPANIPAARRPANAPKELVAVLGSAGEPAGYYLSISRDGRWIAVSNVKAAMRVYDTTTWKEAGAARGFVPAFSPDSKTLVIGDAEGQLQVWDLGGGQLKKQTTVAAHVGEVWALAFAPDGKTLVSGGQEAKKVRVWDMTGKEPRAAETLEDHKSGGITIVAFAPDGRSFASAADRSDIRVYDVKDGKFKQRAVIENKNGGGSMMFSPDGKTLAAPTAVQTGVLWDVSGAQPKTVASLEGYTKRMNSLTYSPDGKRLVSGGAENRVVVWDTSGKKLIEWTAPTGAGGAYIGDTAFAPDGRHVVTANGDGSVWILRVPQQ